MKIIIDKGGTSRLIQTSNVDEMKLHMCAISIAKTVILILTETSNSQEITSFISAISTEDTASKVKSLILRGIDITPNIAKIIKSKLPLSIKLILDSCITYEESSRQINSRGDIGTDKREPTPEATVESAPAAAAEPTPKIPTSEEESSELTHKPPNAEGSVPARKLTTKELSQLLAGFRFGKKEEDTENAITFAPGCSL